MIKEAIKYITELGIKPEERIIFEEGRHFVIDSEGIAHEIKPKVYRATSSLQINTLSGLVAYIRANLERSYEKMYLQVYDETTVLLKGTIAEDGGRETLVEANAIIPSFEYGRFMDTEQLIIALQAKFVRTGDSENLLKAVGNIREENVRNTGDDGVSQAITVKTGVSTVANAKVPNPVSLAPYRTFLEVEQPISEFIFRMKDGPTGAIFEADGGAWRNQAIVNIREYLKDNLVDEIDSGRVTIIA